MKVLILIWSLFFTQLALSYPVGFKGQDQASSQYPSSVLLPASGVTLTPSGSLLETGNDDILIDGSMEASGVTAWTCTVGTCTKTTTAGEFSPPGKQALKVALSAQAMNVSQSVSTGTGSLTQYVIGTKYRVPATMADFQICTLIAGAEKTCVPSANLILDDTYHSIEIPEVITPGSTVGVKFKTTSAYTANAFFDKAYIKQGIGTQALQLDNVYSAQVSSAGVVSNLNKPGWLSGNCSVSATSTFDCPIATGLVGSKMNCVATPNGNSTSFIYIPSYDYATSTSTNARFYTTRSSDAVAVAVNFVITCQKSGNDYLAASAAVYSQSSANTDWAACTFSTLAWQGFGTVTQNLQCKREGGDLLMRGMFTTGTVAAALAQLPLPSNFGTITTSASIFTQENTGIMLRAAAATNDAHSIIMLPSVSYLEFSDTIISNANNPLSAVNGSTAFVNTTPYYIPSIRIPISGWSNSAQIIGSFQNYNSTNGIANPKLFSFNVTTTSGAVTKNKGGIVTSCTAANPTVCTFSGLTTAPNCSITVTGASSGGQVAVQNALATSTSLNIYTYTSSTGAASASLPVDVVCHGD